VGDGLWVAVGVGVGVAITLKFMSLDVVPSTMAYSIHCPISLLVGIPLAVQSPNEFVFAVKPKSAAGVQEFPDGDGTLEQIVTALFGMLERSMSVHLSPT